MTSGSLDYWRRLFRSTGSDIFEVVENAIAVAAADRKDEFLNRRAEIAERLFTCGLDRCRGCDRVCEPLDRDDDDNNNLSMKEKESKVDGGALHENPNNNSNYSYDEAEALTEEMEEEGQVVGEVLRIKHVLNGYKDESDSTLFESLRRLQLMALSVEALKASEIGRSVNRLRKHSSKQIRNLARTLIDGWKLLVDEWVNTAPAVPDNSPDSVNPSVLDEEEGLLPFPPLDEGAIFASHTAPMQLSEFFDGMDDDGNLRNDDEYDREHGAGRKPSENIKPIRKLQHPSDFTAPEPREQRRQEPIVRQIKPKISETPVPQVKPQRTMKNNSSTDSGSGRAARLVPEVKRNGQMSTAPQDKNWNNDDGSVRAKLEVAKRKLQEGYQQAENAKRQRTIQVMELQDIPKKQSNNNHNRFSSNVKHKSNVRNWASGRR